MNKHERNALYLFAFLLILGFIFWRARSAPSSPRTPAAPEIVSSPPVVTPHPVPAAPAPKVKPPPPAPATGPTPPKLQLHKELIPKDITIVRCYYSQEIAPPGSTFGFDINGSGFTREFEKMIRVESGAPGVGITNLKLVTANQIHGEMVVGSQAATAFVYPRVLIKGLPVFSAPDPFAVVRPGEVLTIVFISMDDSGRSGRFRVITNLDAGSANRFRVEPSTAGLEVSNLEARLPHAVEGTLRIGQRVPPGEYGLVVFIGDKPVYRHDGMIHIVRPNVGLSGFVQGVTAAERYHRPGDAIQLYVYGSGLLPEDINQLSARVNEYDMGPASFTYISGAQLRLALQSPDQAPPGSYGLTVSGTEGRTLYEKSGAFELVPPNWIAGVQIAPPAHPGQKGALKILGRDLSSDFAGRLRIEVDEEGLSIGALRRVSASALEAEIAVSSSVAPGDYWLRLSADGRKIEPPYGSIIKIQPAP